MFITIINDSIDDNAKGRQLTRWSTLFPGVNIAFIGVNSSLNTGATIQASGNLIDILDASSGEKGIIALNVAPRGQVKEDGENGSKFSYFYYKKTLVISTIKKYNLSLIKKFKLANHICVLDTEKVLDYAKENNLINRKLNTHITKTQFRSYEFQPRVAKWLSEGVNLPHEKVSIDKFPDSPNAVWHIDSFGNIKTTLTISDIDSKSRPERSRRIPSSNTSAIKTNRGDFMFYERLKDIPDGETAIYTGSSGIGNNRFLEIATQNRTGSAAKHLKLKIGDEVKLV